MTIEIFALPTKQLDKPNWLMIGVAGHCNFCGCEENGHGYYPDGSEDWDCPHCGFCEDYHLGQLGTLKINYQAARTRLQQCAGDLTPAGCIVFREARQAANLAFDELWYADRRQT